MQFIDLKAQYETIKDKVQMRINNVLEHGMYINGPEIKEFEEKLAAYVGCKHAIAYGNGTDALLAPLMAMGIKPGDEVIVPAFTFYATSEMVSLLGATPVFADIDPQTYLIDVQDIKKKITSKTKCIIPVSLYGQIPEMDEINELALKHGIMVLEDAAQSFGATYKGKQSGNLTPIASTSFFPAKPLGCYGDGGAIFTNDSEMNKVLREIREHGSERRYYHTRVGLNARLDTIQCAILLEKLAIFPKEVELRHQIAKRYDEMLEGIKKIKVQSHNTCVYAQYTIEVKNRDEVQKKLADVGVPTSVHYPLPLYLQPVYKNQFGHLKLIHSENAANNVMSLPMHPYLSVDDQKRVVSELKKIIL